MACLFRASFNITGFAKGDPSLLLPASTLRVTACGNAELTIHCALCPGFGSTQQMPLASHINVPKQP